jgi:hypothetical protein
LIGLFLKQLLRNSLGRSMVENPGFDKETGVGGDLLE